MEYIDQLIDESGDGCFLCRARDNPDQDAATFTLLRGETCFAILNRFPYTSGHTLIAPYAHTGDLDDLDDATLLEIMTMTRRIKRVLGEVFHAEGFNVGINLGRCAGAGLPGHLHLHVVPRWPGDTNFMPVLDNIRVIPEAIEKFYRRIREAIGGE